MLNYNEDLDVVCRKIEEGQKNRSMGFFEDAIGDLAVLVEHLLNTFYNEYISTFSTDDQKGIREKMEKITGGRCKKFEDFQHKKLTLGTKFDLLRQCDFIEKAENINGKKFGNLKKLRDSDFVSVRNRSQHAKDPSSKMSIDCDAVIRQFNLISAVLTELGYKEVYEFEVRERINFFDYFRQIEKEYATVPKLNFEEELLSGFTYNSEQIDLVDEICKLNNNFLIVGDGGIGKTTILNVVCQKINEFNKTMENCFDPHEKNAANFLPIPIIVSGSKLHISDIDYEFSDFTQSIAKVMGKSDFKISEVANKLTELYNQIPEKADRPLIILLFDGFNEMYGLSADICEKILDHCKQLSSKHIQIVATSRTDVFPTDKEDASSADNKAFFKRISANGLNEEKIVSYIHSNRIDVEINNIRDELKNQKTFDVLKNPMLLKLYTKYQFDKIAKNNKNSEEESKYIQTLVEQKNIVPIESNSGDMCKAYIFWNYVQYVLYNNVFRPIFDGKHKEQGFQAYLKGNQEKYAVVVSEFIPKIAWDLVSNGYLEIESLGKTFEKQIKDFSAEHFGSDDESFSSGAMRFLIATTNLLRSEKTVNNEYSTQFSHQNFRDFFAACYYTKEYRQLSNCQTNPAELHDQLKAKPILSDVKMLAGELLGERDDKRSLILQNILKVYQEKGNSGMIDDYAVENIFEIYKALDTLNPIEFIRTDLERLNFNDVNPEKIISFVKESLGTINLDQLLLEIKPVGKKKDAEILKKLTNLLKLSAHCANYLRSEDTRKIYLVWLTWAKKMYRNQTPTPSKSLLSKISYVALSFDSITTLALTNIGYKTLTSANLGIGRNDFLNIFKEVKESKSDIQTLMEILDKKAAREQLKNDSIANAMYNLASRNDYTSNVACFLLNYYLFYNVDDGLELIEKLTNRMLNDPDPVKRTMMQFRIISGINFYVQESWCHKKIIPNEVKKNLQKQMNYFLGRELENFTIEIATNYKNFKYNYYFPFGNYFCFDNGIECAINEYSTEHHVTEQNTKEKVFAKIFDSNTINSDLFEKVILDVACVSTNTFFVQNEIYANAQGNEETKNGRYLANTYKFFQELIFKLYPVNSTNLQYGSMTEESAIWESLQEALAILYHYYPLKTEQFLNKISRCYLDKKDVKKSSCILSLKNSLRHRTEKPFKYLCYANRKGEEYTIAGFMKNYKNVLAFADLAINVFMSFPIVTETLVMWFEKSFLKNIANYEKNPKNFIKQTLKELISILKMPESKSNFATVKEALENVR